MAGVEIRHINMHQLKTTGIPCLLTCAVGVFVIGYVFPFVLAFALANTLPLFELITNGKMLFGALFFLQMIILIILYFTALMLLLKCFCGKKQLVSLSLAFSASIFLLITKRHCFFNILQLSELITEVFLIVSVSLIILWRKTKQPAPPTNKNITFSETEKQ